MGRLYPRMRERPMEFRINYDAPLAEGLVFAGLGGHGCVGSMVYPDSSLYGNHGRLNNMDAATDWVWDDELRRWTGHLGDTAPECIVLPDVAGGAESLALFAWVNISKETDDNDLWTRGVHEGGNPLVIWRDRGEIDKWAFLVTDTDGTYSNVKYSATTAASNSWCAFYWDFRPETARLYIDGIQDGASPWSLSGITDISSARTFHLRFGIDARPSLTKQFIGNYADILMWRTPRSDLEIAALADPSNVDLRVGGVPLILPPRRRLFASVEIPYMKRRSHGLRVGCREPLT